MAVQILVNRSRLHQVDKRVREGEEAAREVCNRCTSSQAKHVQVRVIDEVVRNLREVDYLHASILAPVRPKREQHGSPAW